MSVVVAQTVAMLVWTSSARAELVEIDGNGFYMAADASCVQRPILKGSIWLECNFGGRKIAILARSDIDLDWPTRFFASGWNVDPRPEMLAALVVGSPLQEIVGQTRGIWGVGTRERLSGEGFLYPSGVNHIRDVTKMVMFHAVQKGDRTMGVVAVGDLEIVTGPEAAASHLQSIRRLPNSVRAMLKSFRIEDFKY